ncbi:MAG: diguanylate cyclase [Pseudomonadota bacterium]
MRSFDPRPPLSVSVVAGDQGRAIFLCETLQDVGLDACAADFAKTSDVLLFDLHSCPPDLAAEMAEHASTQDGRRPLTAALGFFDADDAQDPIVDIRFSSDAALIAAPMRIEFARRAATRRAEAELRRESFARFGCKTPSEAENSSRKVLFVGDASALFPTLSNGLADQDLTLTAAFSTYSAFDFLHEDQFAAVIVDGGADWVRPGSFCAMVRRSPSLTELPIAAILPVGADLDDDLATNATDMIEDDAPTHAMVRQIVNLIEDAAPTRRDLTAPQDAIADDLTALFSREFFEDHLERQIAWSETFGQPLTLAAFRLRVSRDKDGGRDIAHAAHVVKSLLRMQDVPTRLDTDLIGVSMPGATFAGAHGAARRIAGVLDVTAFDAGDASPAVQVGVDWRIVERRRGQTAQEFIRSALEGGPFERGVVAA